MSKVEPKKDIPSPPPKIKQLFNLSLKFNEKEETSIVELTAVCNDERMDCTRVFMSGSEAFDFIVEMLNEFGWEHFNE